MSLLRTFVTDIKPPRIQSISWSQREVIIKWVKADGAKHHVIKLLDEKDNIVHTRPINKTLIKLGMTRSCGYEYGNTCTCIIEASSENGQMKMDKKSELIGVYNCVS